MKIWINNKFEGHYPVGTAAVVIAKDKSMAKDYLDLFLAKCGLPECEEEQFEEMPHNEGEVRILCDGNY